MAKDNKPDEPSELETLREQLKAESDRRAAVEAELVKARAIPASPLVPTAAAFAKPQRADLASFKDGSFKKRNNDEVFQLRKVEANSENVGRTHQLANADHYVELTEDEFRLQFDKADKA